ncbi:MAG: hypothetical protein D6732_00465, partial [Methanobacteriota archaeon]
PDEIPYEWPKNTKQVYVALVAIWLGGEVKDDFGKTIQIIDFPTFRQSPSGGSWNLEPVPGYLNPDQDQIARSDDPSTWPTAAQGGWRDKRDDESDPGWVGSWNGFFGKNIFNADVEMYYKASDDLYDRFAYTPDETDPTRGGLGLLVDVRAFAWTQVLVNDALFFIHDILNDGTKRIPKTSFLIWLADVVGGDGDTQDDEPFLDLQTSIAFLTDHDGKGNDDFGDTPVGVASIKYLETPGNAVDGIDNDGDADQYPELFSYLTVDPDSIIPKFTENDFQPRTLGPGDKIVIIDSLFNRIVMQYPANGGKVVSLGKTFNLPPQGITLFEDTLANNLDDDLDGLIDERLTLHLERFNEITGTVEPVRYINYLAFNVGDTIKRGFITPGLNAELSYANVAPMIDESRDDGWDNDQDWDPVNDDVGLYGDGSGPGAGDGIPTSGAGTNFPGEPNIDKTDVSETDLIGVTSAKQDPAGGINFNSVSDAGIWRKFMTPGDFYLPRSTGEFDLFVASGYFPMDPGERQRMAVAIAIAGGSTNKNDNIQSAIQKQKQAQTAYESDYQFAQAPYQVTVKAVAGDGKVTLYWDDLAEESEDRFIKRLGGIYKDFEGYRIYRATDPAFLDAKVITDAFGTKTLLKPIAQFDKKDGIKGLHPVAINGVQFYLGDDTGLQHSFVDTTVKNGQRYFYAVTAYDFGYEAGNIPPTETPIKISVGPTGEITYGSNVAVVRPEKPVAGYLPAEVESFEHVSGTSSGQINIRIVDPNAILSGHEYEITFEDTLIKGTVFDNLVTKNYTLTDLTDGTVKISKSVTFREGEENPIVDGFQLEFKNEEAVELNPDKSGWNSSDVYQYQFSLLNLSSFGGEVGEIIPNDYMIVIGDVGFGRSKDTAIFGGTFPLPAKDVNFKVYNISDKDNPKEIEFAFYENHGNDGKFSIDPNESDYTDNIIFIEKNFQGKKVFSWNVILNTAEGNRNPQAGDTLTLILRKPFLSQDVYRFKMVGPREDKNLAKQQLDNIKVVPNPYIAAASWEPMNPYSSGRGPRELHFTNLPKKCTIRIYSVDGTLVDVIEHNSTLENGTAVWDMLSRDNLNISYGVYLYVVEAPGIGVKKGTFAVIK